jgi:putative colanic acid biosynthesis acetyltransferase WcaF
MSKYYSKKEIVSRVIWAFVKLAFFRFSPRIFYGWRNFLLRLMGAQIGVGVKIYPSADIMFPWLLTVGDRTVISWHARIYNLGHIKIGRDTVISQHAHLCGGTHDYKSKDFLLLRTGLTIGSNVWIAADSFIGPGVEVRDNSVVAARAVVVKNVDTGTVVGGNPGRVISTFNASARVNHTVSA